MLGLSRDLVRRLVVEAIARSMIELGRDLERRGVGDERVRHAPLDRHGRSSCRVGGRDIAGAWRHGVAADRIAIGING
jgi:hypothetical protein